jgi:uncharacterized OB-fold protein
MIHEDPPQPAPSIDSKPYWDSLKAGVFAIQRCTACREWQFPMIERCRHCAGELKLEPLSGRGSIHTYIIEHRKLAPGFDALLPYPIGLVNPEEAPHVRIPGRVMADSLDAVKIGAAVTAEIVDLPGGDYKLPVYRIASRPT